jgi:IS30 family transposase
MGDYTHLTVTERRRLFVWREMGLSISVIAKCLKRDRSTLYRELARNQSQDGYLPIVAHQKAKARTQQDRTCKLQENSALYDYIIRHLKMGWSPEQIAGRMKQEGSGYDICHETIYRYIYRQKNKGLYHCLAYKKPHREKRFTRKTTMPL